MSTSLRTRLHCSGTETKHHGIKRNKTTAVQQSSLPALFLRCRPRLSPALSTWHSGAEPSGQKACTFLSFRGFHSLHRTFALGSFIFVDVLPSIIPSYFMVVRVGPHLPKKELDPQLFELHMTLGLLKGGLVCPIRHKASPWGYMAHLPHQNGMSRISLFCRNMPLLHGGECGGLFSV